MKLIQKSKRGLIKLGKETPQSTIFLVSSEVNWLINYQFNFTNKHDDWSPTMVTICKLHFKEFQFQSCIYISIAINLTVNINILIWDIHCIHYMLSKRFCLFLENHRFILYNYNSTSISLKSGLLKLRIRIIIYKDYINNILKWSSKINPRGRIRLFPMILIQLPNSVHLEGF